MSENSGDKVSITENYGVGINKGNINNSKFARTIYESQQQNLAEAARDQDLRKGTTCSVNI